MNKISTRKIAFSAIGVALMFVTTAFVKMPLPNGVGYVHLGDAVLFLFGCLFGPFVGAVTGGLGGFFADLNGFVAYSGYSLIIKAVQGFIVGYFAKLAVEKNGKLFFGYFFFIMLLSGVWMIVAYFFVNIFMAGFELALGAILGDIMQVLLSTVIALLAYPQINRIYKANEVQKEHEELQKQIDEELRKRR